MGARVLAGLGASMFAPTATDAAARCEATGDHLGGRAMLRDWFLAEARTPRPIFIQQFDGLRVGRAYALKPDFRLRISLDPRRFSDGSRSTFSTRSKPIFGSERVELALALDRAGLDRRLFLKGYELVEFRGEVEIAQTSLARGGPRRSDVAIS
jgi:hypothetical protein